MIVAECIQLAQVRHDCRELVSSL